MTAPELGYGEGAEGDPGPSVVELSPATSTDRTAARVLKLSTLGSGVRIYAAFAGQAEELVWTASGFVGLYAAASSVTGPDLLTGITTFTIRRSPFWPSGASGLRVEATGEGESVGIGAAGESSPPS